MNIHAQVLNITQEDLVDLFSTAFYDSLNFCADAKAHIYDAHKEEGDCFEDVLAKVVLDAKVADEKMRVYDLNTEEGDEPTGNLTYDKTKQGVIYYYVGMKEIVEGLQRAANSEDEAERKAFFAFLNREEDCDWDADCADILMQIIVFGEVIYG
jgi:hypothetical protein